MQLTKFSKLKIIHTPGKNLSVADMLSRSFTKAELQLNQLKHKHLPPQIDFALLQDNTLKPVHYLIKHEEILPHQKHDSHPIHPTKPFINNLSYLMILTLQVMTKIIFTPEFQNLTLPSYKTQHYKKKIILLLNNQLTIPHKNRFLQ